ncbi:MAG: hypothetical protein U9N79_03755 [Actinomycetota bacterium]|nr:hypothetical protein [Actinomycetota bacterium]
MSDLDTMLQDFASFIEEELPPPDVGRVLSAAATPPATLRRWLRPVLVAAASAMLVLVVVGLPFLFLSGDDSTVSEPSTTTAAPTTTVTPTATPPTTVQPTPAAPAEVVPFPPSDVAVLDVPLSEAVPGFTDTIVMSSAWSGDGDGVIRWRSSESTTELLLSPERTGWWLVGLDASANWVAQFFDDNVLAVQALPTVPGELSQREIVGHDADDVVWHDTESGHLAWLECPNSFDGPTTLVTLDVSDPSADPIRVRSFDQGCLSGFWGEDESNLAKPVVILEGWGRTGMWVTKRSEDWVTKYSGGAVVDLTESVLVDADGAEIAMVSDAQMIAMSPDGTSIWRRSDWEEPCFFVSPDGQQRSAVPGLSDEDFLGKARWSPDGTRLAMWVATDGGRSSGEDVLRIVDSVSGEVITELKEPVEPDWEGAAAWSTDNRFFVYAPDSEGPATLVFYDTATNTTTMVPIAEDVSDIRVR